MKNIGIWLSIVGMLGAVCVFWNNIIWDASARITKIEQNVAFLRESQDRIEKRLDKFIERNEIRKNASW